MIHASPNLTSSDGTTAVFAIGDTYESGGATWQYCQATAVAIAAYAICSGTSPGAAKEATTTTADALGTAGGFACIPQFTVAASEYFWGLVGPFNTNPVDASAFKVLAANTTAGALLYSTATAGVLDDAATTVLAGLKTTVTVTTQAATACTSWRRLGWVR